MVSRIPTNYANEFRFFFTIGIVTASEGESAEDAEPSLARFGFQVPMAWCLRAFYAGYEHGCKKYADE